MTGNNKMGYSMLYFDEIDSTNEEAKRQADNGVADRLLIVAGHQTKGKGRRGRSWESPAGGNIFMSLLLRPDFTIESASMVTLVMALSVAQTIRGLMQLPAFIKWPNDIVIEKKKVVGILTELHMKDACNWYLICGVGINVNQKEFPGELSQTATSLWLEQREDAGGSDIDSDRLTHKVMERFEENYALFGKRADMSDLMRAYNELLVNKDAAVKVLDPKGEFEGTALGINKLGELLVQKQDGSMENIYAGEVSVRGIYGYV